MCRTIGLSDYRTVGLSDCRTIGLSHYSYGPVDKATHIGITRSDTNSARTTVDENIRKARRATYSLMGTGLHGENSLDPETSISLLKTYILPILTYGHTKRKNIR